MYKLWGCFIFAIYRKTLLLIVNFFQELGTESSVYGKDDTSQWDYEYSIRESIGNSLREFQTAWKYLYISPHPYLIYDYVNPS